MDYKKILALILWVTFLLLIKTHVFPAIACSLLKEKVDTEVGIQEFKCNTDLDCQLFDTPTQKLVYFWRESEEEAQIGVEINTTQTREKIYRRVCENGICVPKQVETYYLPFTFSRKDDRTLEIPTYMVEGRKCVAFGSGECSSNVSGKIKFYKDLNSKIVDIKCITCNSTSNTINGSIEIERVMESGKIVSTLKVKRHVIEECEPVCGASVECAGALPNEFIVKEITKNYYSVGFCNASCQFIPLTLESFRVYVIDVCIGKVEISPQSSLILTDEDKLYFHASVNAKSDDIPVGVTIVVEIVKKNGEIEETIKRCENVEVCEAVIDASPGSYFAMLTVIEHGEVVKLEKSYPISVREVIVCKDENCGVVVRTEYRSNVASVKKCLCSGWSCGERGGCCRNEECGKGQVCKNCVCMYESNVLVAPCLNITGMSVQEAHSMDLTLGDGSHANVSLPTYKLRIDVEFNNDVPEETFQNNNCSDNYIYVLDQFYVIPSQDLPDCPYLNYDKDTYTYASVPFSTPLKPGGEWEFTLELITRNNFGGG